MITKASVKKTLGIVTVMDILAVATISVLKAPAQVSAVLTILVGLAVALFGIKAYTGIQAKKLDNGKQDE